jgi:FKBP-type peptidyl-prolyl cis-trans isomerase
MKMLKTLAVLALATTCSAFAKEKAAEPVHFKSQQDSIAYAIGTNWGSMMKKDSLYFDVKVLAAGINDALNADKLALTDEQIAAAFQTLNQKMTEKQQKITAEKADKAKAEGDKFLAENKKKAGVKVTASGLQYEVLTPGKGKTPTPTSKVKVHYTGTLLSGKVFDSSVERKQPAEFGLNQVIKGWTEGLQLMQEGAKYKFYIPGELGYGVRGAGADIGPNETLIFEVELLEVQSDAKQ